MAAAYDEVPVGFRFHPDAEQLLLNYLGPKLNGEYYPIGLIQECDLYGNKEPWEIWEESLKPGEDKQEIGRDLYFFTQLKKKSPKRFLRSVGGNGGTWHGEDSGNKVFSSTTSGAFGISCRVIGFRKRFKYVNKNKKYSHQDGRWLMHEYSLGQNDDYVVCILRKNDEKSADEEIKKPEEEEEDGGYHNINIQLFEWDTSSTIDPVKSQSEIVRNLKLHQPERRQALLDLVAHLKGSN